MIKSQDADTPERRRPGRKPTVSREAWLEGAWALLAEGGDEGLRVEVLARRLSITKGSFYWHFADREALLQAVLDAWEKRESEGLTAQLHGGGEKQKPKAQLRALLAWLAPRLGGEAGLRLWARRDKACAKVVATIDAQRLSVLEKAFAATGSGGKGSGGKESAARARLAYALLLTDPFLQTPGETAEAAEERALKLLVKGK
ncbi:TetR/AcrR family transcriptional regulator [Limibacillus halophilus]